MSWCVVGLVATRLGRCLAVTVPDGSELLTGKVTARLGPLCRLVASMLGTQPSSAARRELRIGKLIVIVRAREHFYVAVVVTREEHVQSAGVVTSQLVAAIEARALGSVCLAAAAEQDDADVALAAYTATSALNGAADAAEAELRTLPPFADFEARVLRPLLSAPPCGERWFAPLLANPLARAVFLLSVPDASSWQADGSSSARILLTALAEGFERAPTVELARLADADVWMALSTACVQAGARAEHTPFAVPGLSCGHLYSTSDADRLRALVRVASLSHGARIFVILFYVSPHAAHWPSLRLPRHATLDPGQRRQQAMPARMRWLRFSWRPRVQPRPFVQLDLVSSSDAQALVTPLRDEAIPPTLADAFSALCAIIWRELWPSHGL